MWNPYKSSAAGGRDKTDETAAAKTRGLYGDTVNLAIGAVVCPLHAWMVYQMAQDDPLKPGAIRVMAFMCLPQLGSCLLTVALRSLWWSRVAFLATCLNNVQMDAVGWPHGGECTITAHHANGVIVAVLANVSLSFREKLVRLAVLFSTASFVSVRSPHSVYLEDTFPVLGGIVLLAAFVLYVHHRGVGRTVATVHAARLVLMALFVHQTAMNLAAIPSSEGTAFAHLVSLGKASAVACVGGVATGAFHEEILRKERLEEVVRKRTQKLHMVDMALQSSETAIVITDEWGRIVWLNATFQRLSGDEEEGLLGSLLKNVIFHLDRTRKENKYLLMEMYEDSSKANEEELQIGHSVFRVEATPFSSEAHGDGPKANDRFLVAFKDITAGRAREVAEKRAHHEATMAKAMGESMMTLTHELRTPLQGIMGVTSLMLQQASDLTDDSHESLKLIMASSTLLLNLINNLLDVRKATAQMMEDFPLTAIQATGPIKDAVGFCKPLASISNVRILTDVGSATNTIVHSNALRLQQIMINVISNAIKYTRRGSDIRITIREVVLRDVRGMIDDAMASTQSRTGRGDDDSFVLVFSVSDRGPGIPTEQAGRLFHRFAQLDTRPTRTLGSNCGQPSGTGLGLHLCQLFVERMHGQMWATNNKEEDGATFQFYLPLVADAAYSIRKNPGITQNAMVPYLRSSSRNNLDKLHEGEREPSTFDHRVLLVDNDAILRKVYHRMLKKIGVKHLVTAESAERALEELSRDLYDLVITDLQMPGMSGAELSAAIRSGQGGAARPIVVGLTADTSASERCSETGMSDVLYKPITVSEMKGYFETTLPNLKPGIWYDANSAYDMDYLGMNVISMQISKQSAAKKNERLLLEVFPENIADALREGKRIEPQHHDIVTIYFSDIVGFTNISSVLTPIKVSSMLDRLYLKFDQLSRKHDVFKIETIGDAYMAVTNLVKKQDDHVKRIANFSKDTIDAALSTLIDEDKPELGHVKIRVGFHSGPVVSNVVGSRNPKFTIIGDTVNAASRMESNSKALQIQCSESSALILKEKHPDVPCTLRGHIKVKGKGEMMTYWVHSKPRLDHGDDSSPECSTADAAKRAPRSEFPRPGASWRGVPRRRASLPDEIPGMLSSGLNSLASSTRQSLLREFLSDHAVLREDGHARARPARLAVDNHVCDQPDAAAGGICDVA